MKGGWFIGDFYPSLLNTDKFEVAVKRYKKGEWESSHAHKVATEYTVIVSGKVRMNNEIFMKDSIIVISPNEYTDFEALEDTDTLVIKTPSVKGDKYLK
jgi:mannose-6-phosphate isomerase-like protein (cupin superfamily)